MTNSTKPNAAKADSGTQALANPFHLSPRMRFLACLIISTTCILLLCAGSPGNNSYDERARQLKAEYIYMQSEAEIEKNDDNAAAYSLMVHANRTDPFNIDIAGRLAEINLRVGFGDSAQKENEYNILLLKYLDNPADIHSAGTFLEMAETRRDFPNILRVFEELTRHNPDRNDIALQYAVALVEAADAEHSQYYDSALVVCDRVAKRLDDESNVDVLLRRLFVHEARKDTVAFINELQRYYKTAPENPEIITTAATFYETIHMSDSSMVFYGRACAIDSTFGPAFLGRANLLMQRGDTVGYNREVFNVIKSNGLDFGTKMEMLKDYNRHFIMDTVTGRKEIARMYEVMQDLHPGEAELHFHHGIYQLFCNNHKEGAEHLSYAIDLNPEERNYHSAYMDAAILSGDTIGAVNAGRRAYQRFEEPAFALMAAAYLSLIESPKAAIELLDSIDTDNIKDYEQRSLIHQTRGDFFYRMEQVDSALAEYDTAIEINPYNSGAMNNAAYFLALESKELDKALNYIEKVMKIDGNNPTNIDTYAWVLFKRKDYEGARKQIDRALCHYTDPTDSVEYAVGEKIVCPEFGEIQIAEASSDVLDHAGDIYFMTGEPELALRFWELALALEPKNEKIKKKVNHKTYFFE